MIQKGVPVFDIARNMGTSVQIIESYYGRSATPVALATRLGDWLLDALEIVIRNRFKAHFRKVSYVQMELNLKWLDRSL